MCGERSTNPPVFQRLTSVASLRVASNGSIIVVSSAAFTHISTRQGARCSYAELLAGAYLRT
jgi:hypothetical protein